MLRKILIGAALVLIAGCWGGTRIVDGTSLSLGAYLPLEGQIYGMEIASYVNGCVVRVPTNTFVQVERVHSSTNSWLWGALETVESSSVEARTSK